MEAGMLTAAQRADAPNDRDGDLDAIRAIARGELSPLVQQIDANGLYPEQVLRRFGEAGAFSAHLPGYDNREPNLGAAIAMMSLAGEYCLSTAFCMWCQDALGWYIYTSDNGALKQHLGAHVATGDALGGTGLSNPMKSFFGIERLKLKGRRVPGGFRVTGALPWVSNLGPDHYFGSIFELDDDPGRRVMAVFGCSDAGVTIVQNDHFVALEGTRTFTVQLRDVFVPELMVLADPIDGYIPRIRSGFILLQAGMAVGLIRSCIELMRQMQAPLGHVNRFLELQPDDFAAKLDALEREVLALSATPFETQKDYWRRVIQARLEAGELSVAAAHHAMLHCGARGYVATGAAQRKLRESYFVAIVTPATKQLRKMLSDLDH
jgi:alkylation response protein AidB-like acyl-CoA dehydrogenase